MKLWQLFEKDEYANCEIEYEYDFGDNWEHKVTLMGREEAGESFVCLEGGGHGVAEDVGSRDGWKKLKAAYRADRPNAEQKDKMRWFESKASNRDPQGLKGERVNVWDKEKVNGLLRMK